MSDTNKQKVQFWRGKTLKANPDDNNSTNGEIIFLNDTMGETGPADEKDRDAWNIKKKLGSIYQDDKIVGTTRAEQLMTTSPITVAGGPLADDLDNNWPEDSNWTVDGNKTIPAGVSIQEILEKLFLKETNGTATWGSASWSTTPSYAAPSVALSSDGPVEYGTSLTISTLSAGATTNGNRRVVCECTQGYFDENSDIWHSENKTLNAEPTISGTQSLTATWNGEKVSNPVVNTSLEANKLGENKLEVTQSGEKATHTAFEDCTVYPSTNTKKKISDKPAKFTGDKGVSVDLSNSNNDSVNAYYKYYYFTTTTSPTSLTKIPDNASSAFLTGYTDNATTSTTKEEVFLTIPDGSKAPQYGVIMMPNTYEPTSLQTNLGTDGLNQFTSNTTTYTYTLPNDETITYTLYYKSNAGAGTPGYKNLVITKKKSNN